MATQTYLAGRKTYKRPQAMLWSDAPPTTVVNSSSQTNIIANLSTSSYESGTTNWTYPVSGGSAGTIASNSTDTKPYVGTSVAKVTATAAGGNIGIIHSASILTVTAGNIYTFSMYVKDGTVAQQFRASLEFRSAGGSALQTFSGSFTTVNSEGWTRVFASGLAPATSTNVRVYVYSAAAPAIGQYVYFDGAMLQQTATVISNVSDVAPYVEPEYIYVPDGYEVGQSIKGEDFIVLSDHNRKDISFKPERIEKRERMINGRMRSYHIADKMTISTSWDMLPSRSFSNSPNFNSSGEESLETRKDNITGQTVSGTEYTVDGGAGGNELLEWYQNHTGSFWVFLAYDNLSGFSVNKYSKLSQYGQVIEMFISSFDYTVTKRGGSNHDFWNVSVTLEEV